MALSIHRLHSLISMHGVDEWASVTEASETFICRDSLIPAGHVIICYFVLYSFFFQLLHLLEQLRLSSLDDHGVAGLFCYADRLIAIDGGQFFNLILIMPDYLSDVAWAARQPLSWAAAVWPLHRSCKDDSSIHLLMPWLGPWHQAMGRLPYR